MGRWVTLRRLLAIAAVIVGMLGLPFGPAGSHERAYAQRVAQQGGSPGRGPAGVLPADGSWTVTLLTGEVVEVRSDAEGRVTAAVRKHSGAFRTVRKPGGDIYVFPVAITAALRHALDPELFNVTGLIRQGYDDAASDVVPVIVERRPGTNVAATMNGEAGRQLRSIGAVAVEVPKARAEATGARLRTMSAEIASDRAAAGITHVWLDRRVTALGGTPNTAVSTRSPGSRTKLDHNLTQIGADDAWRAGFTGEDVTIAVLDSGIDATHPDLTGKVVARKNFSDSPDTVDRFGHGTHVAAIAAGSGAAADGARRGVAPDADLVVGKVLGDQGFGQESEVIAGMEWAAPKADVVNMSLGTAEPSDGSDPLSTSLDRLAKRHDTLFVVSAGNSGPASKTIGSPAAAGRALAVGAVDGGDNVADFSSRGPLAGSDELKPEVVAPGVGIIAARAAGTALGEPLGENYTRLSGTSMAAPHVSGAAAVVAQQHPAWSAEQVKRLLIGSTELIKEDRYDAGAGRIDLGAAITTGLLAGRDVVDVPLTYPRTKPHTESLRWTNTAGEELTITLDAELEDRQGNVVGEMSVKPAKLTIAPGHTGSASIRIDAPDLAAGLYSGAVTASVSSPGNGAKTREAVVHTPVAVHAAAKKVELSIEATSPAGPDAPVTGYASIINLNDYATFNAFVSFEGKALTVQVPAGKYSVTGDVSTGDPANQVVAQVGDPYVTVNHDTTVTFDGAAAVPLDPTVVGVETTTPSSSGVTMITTPDAGTDGFGVGTAVYASYPVPPIRVTPMKESKRFSATAVYRLQAPHVSARIGDEAIDVTTVPIATAPSPGTHTVPAVDVGNGDDFSGAGNRLAVVRLPEGLKEQAAITRRAADAGVAILAFVDKQRSRLTVNPLRFDWADVLTIAAGGESAAALIAAAQAGEDVTVEIAASPYVYDIVGHVRPHPVIDKAEQAKLATIEERFHRDPDGTGVAKDRRYADIGSPVVLGLNTQGPLPRSRTAHVSPDSPWQSVVYSPLPGKSGLYATSMNAGESYASGSRHALTWLRRPQWPGPVGGPIGLSSCQPAPVRRSGDVVHVWLAPFQDGLDRYGCAGPREATLTLERGDTVIGSVKSYAGSFTVPAHTGTYRLTYEQVGQAPYAHRSATTWTFQSAAPDDSASVPIPLLVVDYDLPLDTFNRPTGDTATLTVGRVTGTPSRPIHRMTVWTSTDDGKSWQRAAVRRTGRGTYAVTLPKVPRDTGVSMRVHAEDTGGSRIEQTLYDAYRA